VPSHLRAVAEPSLLRSYYPPPSVPDLPPFDHLWLVSDAALATSAAPFYFEPYSPVDGHTFTDASAFGFNNPAETAVTEAKQIPAFRGRTINCIVSIGTGMTPLSREDGRAAEQHSESLVRKAFSKINSLFDLPQEAYSRLDAIGNDLINVATNTERTHYSIDKDFVLGYVGCALLLLSLSLNVPIRSDTYFRFNPPSDLGKIDLADYERGAQMETITTTYLGQPETRRMIEDCVRRIKGLPPRSEDKSLRPDP
jgi:hypothetical protein